MESALKSILVIFFLSLAALAQPVVVTFAPGDCCSTVYQDGKAFYVIRDANVSVMVSAQQAIPLAFTLYSFQLCN